MVARQPPRGNGDWGLACWWHTSVLTSLLVKTGSDMVDVLAFCKTSMAKPQNSCKMLDWLPCPFQFLLEVAKAYQRMFSHPLHAASVWGNRSYSRRFSILIHHWSLMSHLVCPCSCPLSSCVLSIWIVLHIKTLAEGIWYLFVCTPLSNLQQCLYANIYKQNLCHYTL